MIGSIAMRLPFCLSVPQRSHGRTKRTESHWHKMRGLHRRTPRLARVFSDCSADSRQRKLSGSRCTASGQPRVLMGRDGSSWWQTEGASRHGPIKRLTPMEIASEFDVLDPQLAQPLLRQWITKLNRRGAHADFGSSGSVPAGLADDADGRSDSRRDPVRANWAGHALAVVAAIVGATRNIPQHRHARL